jgi:hypothetical protein
MEYEAYVRREVFEFLRRCRSADRDRLLALLQSLGNDPYRRGDFTERDRTSQARPPEGKSSGHGVLKYGAAKKHFLACLRL